ncbi:MAG: Rrf2 family transcriptional regulator [Candidatus Omnitrophota bacterium]|nr:Rrf2 family transcriptional regulator [Candidatus Omnitrophota bacterium]
MKLITRDTDYALRALVFIARSMDRVVAVTELVQELGIPRFFLRKILQLLHKKGLLKSFKGKGGGFILNRLPQELSLLQVMGVFQGRFSLNECLLKKHLCPNIRTCILKKRIKNIESYVARELEAITIASLIKKYART